MKIKSVYRSMDPTNAILRVMGIGLLIAFFFPILGPAKYGGARLSFINFEIFFAGSAKITGMIRFQMLYPLLAGILLIFASKWRRSGWKTVILSITALLPFVIFFSSTEGRYYYSILTGYAPEFINVWIVMLVEITALTAIFAGTLVVRVTPRNRAALYLAVSGGILYLISMLIPINGKFIFFESLKQVLTNNPFNNGHIFTKGLLNLAETALMIVIVVNCFRLVKAGERKEKIGAKIMTLWYIWLGLLSVAIINQGITRMIFINMTVTNLFSILTIFIKVIPWLLALLHLIPLVIAEIIVIRPRINVKSKIKRTANVLFKVKAVLKDKSRIIKNDAKVYSKIKKVAAAVVLIILAVIVYIILRPGPPLNREASLEMIDAIRFGRADEVKRLITEEGADVNFKDHGPEVNIMNRGTGVNITRQGKTPLHYAAEKGNIEIVRELLKERGSIFTRKGAAVNILDKHGKTPLFYAAKKGNTQVVQELLEKGAAVDFTGEGKDTPLIAAARGGHDDIIKILIEKGAKLDTRGYRNDSALDRAIQNGHNKAVERIVEAGGIWQKSPGGAINPQRQNYLIRAIRRGRLSIVKIFVQHGADIDARAGSRNLTPLLEAIRTENPAIARYLIEKGCRVNETNTMGESPLLLAAKRGDIVSIRALSENGANYDHTGIKGRGVLHYAIIRDRANRNNNLYDKYPNNNLYDKYRNNNLYDKYPVVTELIRYGAKVNAVDEYGNTPLHHAVTGGSLGEVKVLVENGADLYKKNARGETPLDYAIKEKYRSRFSYPTRRRRIVEYLKSLIK